MKSNELIDEATLPCFQGILPLTQVNLAGKKAGSVRLPEFNREDWALALVVIFSLALTGAVAIRAFAE
jgi:hypothetical protein